MHNDTDLKHTKTEPPHGQYTQPNPAALKAGHEVGEVPLAPIYKFGLYLTLLAVVSLGIAYGTFLMFVTYQNRASARPTPMQLMQHEQQPPEPRLQVEAHKDWVSFKAVQDSVVSTYAWVDKARGVVRIPLDRALDIMSTRSWPHQPGMYHGAGVSAVERAEPAAPETHEGDH